MQKRQERKNMSYERGQEIIYINSWVDQNFGVFRSVQWVDLVSGLHFCSHTHLRILLTRSVI
jgi:hypothetical protein